MYKRIARSYGAALILSGGLTLCSTAFAQATPDDAADAKSMLEKAVTAVKADEAKAIDMFNKGEGGFYIKDRLISILLHQGGRQDRRHPHQAGAWQGR